MIPLPDVLVSRKETARKAMVVNEQLAVDREQRQAAVAREQLLAFLGGFETFAEIMDALDESSLDAITSRTKTADVVFRWEGHWPVTARFQRTPGKPGWMRTNYGDLVPIDGNPGALGWWAVTHWPEDELRRYETAAVDLGAALVDAEMTEEEVEILSVPLKW